MQARSSTRFSTPVGGFLRWASAANPSPLFLRFVRVLGATKQAVAGGLVAKAPARAACVTLLGFVFSVTLLGLAAESPAVQLSWSVPTGCPTEEDVQEMLDEALASAAYSETVRASAAIDRTPDGEYVARLVVEMGDRRSERTLSASECSALADATALVIVVTVDPTRAFETARVPAPPAIEVPELAVIDDPVEEPVAPPTTVDTTVRAQAKPQPTAAPVHATHIEAIHLRAVGAIGYGALPAVDGSIGVAFGAHGRWFRFEWAGSWAFARETSAPPAPQARARISLWSMQLRGCGVPAARRVEIPLCAAVEAGALEGRGIASTENARHARRPWVALSAGPSLAWVPIPRLALLVGADVVVPLWRARFLIGPVEVHRPLAVGVRAGGGVELRFGVRP